MSNKAPQLAETPVQPLNLEGVCETVKTEFGAPPDLDLMADPDSAEFVTAITQELTDTHTYRIGEQETGAAQRRTMFALGCTACGIAEICVVKNDLERRAEEAELNGDFMEKASMLASAPTWLNAARINLAGLTPEELAAKSADQDELRRMDKSGEFDNLLAGSRNELEGVYKKTDLPELANVSCIDKDAELVAHKIETKNGNTFSVIDASIPVGFTGTPPDALSYGVLTSKLLNRMAENDPKGHPQVWNEDFKMQKTLASRLPDAPITEFRMNGKNRLYATITPDPKNKTTRIVILGSHGGNSQTQNEFIKHVTA